MTGIVALLLPVARFGHLGALMTLVGVLAASRAILPAARGDRGLMATRTALDRLARAVLCFAAAAGLAWLSLLAADLSGAAAGGDAVAAVPTVVARTWAGHVLLIRAGLLAIVAAVIHRFSLLALIASAAALASEALLGHAAAEAGGAGAGLALSLMLHLLAAAAWIGALPALFLALSRLSPEGGLAAARAFFPAGLGSVVVIAGTALVQASSLIGSLPALIGTGYGRAGLIKTGLFLALLALAAWNHFRLLPAGDARRLRASVRAEAIAGSAVILAACVMASLPPAAHEQPVWPFSLRPSLAVTEDPDLRREVIIAALLALAALAAVLTALVARRGRLIAVALGLAVLWYAVPSLRLLLVEAYPTSYAASPTGFSAVSIADGLALYPDHCASCHGAEGRGDGPAAAGLRVPPADLTAAHLWDHADGELFWWIAHGMRTPEGETVMRGVSGELPDDQIWHLIDAIRARNAGLFLRAASTPPQPVPVPDAAVSCAGQNTLLLSELTGRPLVIAAGVEAPEVADALAIHLSQRALGPSFGESEHCAAEGEAVWTAFATVGGLAAGDLSGTLFLIDRSGWLREAGPAARWAKPGALAAAIARIEATPVASAWSAHRHQH